MKLTEKRVYVGRCFCLFVAGVALLANAPERIPDRKKFRRDEVCVLISACSVKTSLSR